MTREEAIHHLYTYSTTNGSGQTSDEQHEEAKRMAIEALKNEINCVKCVHYTERETYTGIKGVCKMDTAHRGDIIYRNEVAVAIDMADGDTKMADRKDVWDLVQGIPSVNCTRILIGLDLINRQDAIDAFGLSEKTRKYGGDHSGYDTIMLYEIQDVLESLPSANKPTVDKEYLVDLIQEAVYDGEACAKLMDMVDRPTGEWIEVNHVVDTTCECSECHHRDYIPNVETGTDKYECMDRYWFERKFCPNCGAKMKV